MLSNPFYVTHSGGETKGGWQEFREEGEGGRLTVLCLKDSDGREQNSSTHIHKHNQHGEREWECRRQAHRQIGQIIANLGG